jgi:radical SAM enzyme (rSAM/lipoprotein system)
MNCLHCGSDCSQESSFPDMPLSDFLSALDTIKSKPEYFTVVLTGGEPLLRKDLELCGREIRKHGARWSIVTNGYLYDHARHNSLLNSGLGALTISIDGLMENHNWLRNSSDSFSKADIAIGLAAGSSRLNFDVVTCVNKRNLSELQSLYTYLMRKGVKSWRLFTILPKGRAKGNPDLFLSDTEFKNLLDFISVRRRESEMDIKFSCEGYVGSYELKVREKLFFCRAGINIGSVLIDGSISACPNIDRSFSQGNIYNDSLDEIWENNYQVFRDRNWTKAGKCANCSEYNYCLGNGMHNRAAGNPNVLICHHQMIEKAGKYQTVKE